MAGLRHVLLSFVTIACGGFLFGYMIGLTSNIVTKGQLICEDSEDIRYASWSSLGYSQCYEFSALDKGLVSSLNLMGALISCCICFVYADWLGRKLEVQLGALFYFTGSTIAAAAPSMWFICVGMTVYGIGIGFAMHAAPMFIAEISPADIRGTLISAKEAIIVSGIFLGFFAGWLFSDIELNGWRCMIAVASVLSLLMEIAISFIPQSPRYLVLRSVQSSGLAQDRDKRMDEAREALQFFRMASSPAEVEDELRAMRSDVAASVGLQPAKVLDAFNYPYPLIIGCGLVLLQQITGQPSVLYFATSIFKTAGFGSLASISAVLVGLMKLVATLTTVWKIDNFGRRPLLFVGIGMMCVALAFIATAFLYRSCKVPGVSAAECRDADIFLPQEWAILTVVGLMLYVSGYQIGFGPISWVMISEVFPLRVRGAALSLAAIVNFLGNILVTAASPKLQQALTPAGVFYGYFILAVLSLVFVWAVVPETKGKTLEEIESMLSRRSKPEGARSPLLGGG